MESNVNPRRRNPSRVAIEPRYSDLDRVTVEQKMNVNMSGGPNDTSAPSHENAHRVFDDKRRGYVCANARYERDALVRIEGRGRRRCGRRK